MIKRMLLLAIMLAVTTSLLDRTARATMLPPVYRVNVPHFDGPIRFDETAVFWFGRVTSSENYADVRVGYNDAYLFLRVAIFDRRLWYDISPSASTLTAWDSVSLYLDMRGNGGSTVTTDSYEFVGQLSTWENPRTAWQTAYRGTTGGWISVMMPFSTSTGWRGDAPNTAGDDRGWYIEYSIPFASLGLAAPPQPGAIWRLGVVMHDRDSASGPPNADQMWPGAMVTDQPSSWGQMYFGLPVYAQSLSALPRGRVTIRQGLNSATVPDVAVGGGVDCGSRAAPDYFPTWGTLNYAHVPYFNIQNQEDTADWPCFSKAYLTFPLDGVPSGKVIVSATLTLHQFGNAGQGWTPGPQPSYIQVLTAAQDWNEDTLTWNSAPLARENLGGTWVTPVDSSPPYPGGIPYTWDVSRAVAEAYATEAPVRLVVYSADGAYHSGRYFYSSDTEQFNAEGRPTLTVVWGDLVASVDKQVWPLTSLTGQQVTYTLSLIGSGQALTMSDVLPPLVSAPGPITTIGGNPATYDAGHHLLTWSEVVPIGRPVTVTFPVTVLASIPTVIKNTVILTETPARISTSEAAFFANPLVVSLPFVAK